MNQWQRSAMLVHSGCNFGWKKIYRLSLLRSTYSFITYVKLWRLIVRWIVYTFLQKMFCKFISWTSLVNSWTIAEQKHVNSWLNWKVYVDLIDVNLYPTKSGPKTYNVYNTYDGNLQMSEPSKKNFKVTTKIAALLAIKNCNI